MFSQHNPVNLLQQVLTNAALDEPAMSVSPEIIGTRHSFNLEQHQVLSIACPSLCVFFCADLGVMEQTFDGKSCKTGDVCVIIFPSLCDSSGPTPMVWVMPSSDPLEGGGGGDGGSPKMGSENLNDATKGVKAQGGSGGGGEVGGEQVPLAPSPARVSQLPEVTRVMMTVAGTQSIPLILYHQAHDEGGVICDVDEFIRQNFPGGLEANDRFEQIRLAFQAVGSTAAAVDITVVDIAGNKSHHQPCVPMILHHSADDERGVQEDVDRFMTQQGLDGASRQDLLELAIDTVKKRV